MNPVHYPSPRSSFPSHPPVGAPCIPGINYITIHRAIVFCTSASTGVSSYNSLFSLSRLFSSPLPPQTPSPLPLHPPFFFPSLRLLSVSLSPLDIIYSNFLYRCCLHCSACSPTHLYCVLFTLVQRTFATPSFLGPVICLIVYREHYLFVILYLFCNLRGHLIRSRTTIFVLCEALSLTSEGTSRRDALTGVYTAGATLT
ncbi:hypothetical protein GY45DRAFT_212278 [Cubamyces sp. BRFM 1775]|nr:hypothetical protein GY45DRAFT_212278 [Cubamyces sp. BRFM 1775]